MGLLNKIFGSRNDRLVKMGQKKVVKINSLEPIMEKLTDLELQNKTIEFQKKIKEGHSLDSLLIEAFAVVREGSKRVLKMRHFDVQLIGGMVLHKGKIAEMRTGEGKTLVATLAVYLNALTKNGVHVITVNDYLAKRDAELMGVLYNFLGLSVGVIVSGMSSQDKKEAYNADITYGTNNEFGFDYLRDNMSLNIDEQVQRSRNFVVIDEVDSILIDESRTPLVISGASEDSSELYQLFSNLVHKLDKSTDDKAEYPDGDYYLDEKTKQAYLTDKGHEKVESILTELKVIGESDSLYSPQHVTKMYYLNACLRANTLYKKDIDYIIKNNEVVIIDEHTGRSMEGRRWSDGLHQAIEAKENVDIQGENQTMASITFQNFFKLYNKIAGMTGTADTEAFEFQSTYNLEVVVIPTNLPPKRTDNPDVVYGSKKEKFEAIIEDIIRANKKKQPILVGTSSIEVSEVISNLLKSRKIKHNVLNAKQHEREALIIEEAGAPCAITIATNMAGRGTDIMLGGNKNSMDEDLWIKNNKTVIDAGGLYVIGSDRHESRRIDNQLRGRSGRQGDPGESKFYLSFDDFLIRNFTPPRLLNMLKKMTVKSGEALESNMLSNAIEKAQMKVETLHFDMRKNLLEYDNVSNDQRLVIYKQRQDLIKKDNVDSIISNMRKKVAENLCENFVPVDSMEEEWDIESLDKTLKEDFNLNLNIKNILENDDVDSSNLKNYIIKKIIESYENKIKNLDSKALQDFHKVILLQNLDSHWREHLAQIDHLRQSVHLRGYAQKDPKQEYKREAFLLFSEMLDNLNYQIISYLSKVEYQSPEQEKEEIEKQMKKINDEIDKNYINENEEKNKENNKKEPITNKNKVKRNSLCPCKSGKKYKHCCGKIV